MDIVIQCANRKSKEAGYFRAASGQKVCFVAKPELATKSSDILARPDDPSDSPGLTWRARLEQYASISDHNPYHLAKAYKLYAPNSYELLVRQFGEKKVFILSAGWGLVRSDYLLPTYNVTFSKGARSENPSAFRDATDKRFRDFQHLVRGDGPIVFLGGKDYLQLFQSLTKPLHRHIIIYQRADPKAPNYAYAVRQGIEVRPFKTPILTNWHYQCAKELSDGTIRI